MATSEPEPPNLLVLSSLLVANFYYSVAKKSLPVAIPQLQTKWSATTRDLGDLSSAFSISYGVGKVLGGVVSDLAPPYLLYVLGLLLAAFVNLVIVFSNSIPVMGRLWALNAFVQGIGGPALSRLVVDLYPPQERASTWANLTFACNLGYLLSPAVIRPFCLDSWEGAFRSTGLGSLASAVFMALAYLTLPPKQLHPAAKTISGNSNSNSSNISRSTTSRGTGGDQDSNTSDGFSDNGDTKGAGTGSSSVNGRSSGSASDSGSYGASGRIGSTNKEAVQAAQLSAGQRTTIEAASEDKPHDAAGASAADVHPDPLADGHAAGDTCSIRTQDKGVPGEVLASPAALKGTEPRLVPRVSSWATWAMWVVVAKFLLLFAANVLTYFVSKGVQDWTGNYLTEYLQYPRDPTGGGDGRGGQETSLGAALLSSVGWGGGSTNTGTGPEMHIWELSLWPEVGGMVGTVLVGRLAAALRGRQSLACFLFTLVCLAGLWSLALHLPQDPASAAAHYMPGAGAYSQHYFTAGNIDGNGSGAGLVHPEVGSTCVHPAQLSGLSGGTERLCLDSVSLEAHPLEQCQCRSVMLSTIALMFPKAGSSTLVLNQLAVRLGDQLMALVKRVVAVNRYFSMRCALFLIGFGINGPKTLVSFEMMSVVPARFCGTVSGIAGLFAQIGAYFAGRFIALTILQEGWCSYVALLVVGSWLVAALLLLSALLEV